MTTIDFNALMEEAGEGFQIIPPGPYTVEVSKAEATTSSTQKPMIRAQLRILGGPHNGRILFDQYTLTAGNPNALGFFFDTMAAFGLDRAYFSQNPGMDVVAQVLLGRQANVQAAIKPYQGVDRNEVKNYRPVQGGAPPVSGAMPVAGVPQMGAVGTPTGVPAGFPGEVPQMPQQQPAAQATPQFQPVPRMQPQTPQAAATTEMFVAQFGQQAPQPQAPVQQPMPQAPVQQPQPQPQVAPQQIVAPGQQQGQPGEPAMWQPSGPPPGGVQQPAAAPQPVAPPPGVIPPMPQVPQQPERTI